MIQFMILKDRQQEAERVLRCLTLFCSYCMHIKILSYRIKDNTFPYLTMYLRMLLALFLENKNLKPFFHFYFLNMDISVTI